jgi:chemotaxis protein methyltransferase CheR
MLTTEQGFFADLVHRESGIVLGNDKGYLLDSRLTPVAKEMGCADLKGLHEKIRLNVTTETRQRIVQALTTNESLFFRDRVPFQILQKELIPELKGRPTRPIRIWCAAASTGQEPYSIVMSFLETWPNIAPAELSILATDIDNEVIERGKRGIYTQIEINRGLPVMMLARHFKQEGANWILSENVRRFVSWRMVNLIQPFFVPGPFDIIFIRNVLIYFSVETKALILEKMAKALKPDGVLFLGSTESTVGVTNVIQSHMAKSGGVYYTRPKESAA